MTLRVLIKKIAEENKDVNIKLTKNQLAKELAKYHRVYLTDEQIEVCFEFYELCLKEN